MDESGYAEGSNSGGDSSGYSVSEEGVVLISGGTVECPLEKDGTLLLSTLQGQFAGASGLSYIPHGSQKKRAIRYDSASGKLHAPSDGWNGRKYYVSFCLEVETTEESQQRVIDKLKQEVVTLKQLKEVQDQSNAKSAIDFEEFDKLLKERDEYAEKSRVFETELAVKVNELESTYCQKQEVQAVESQVRSNYESELVTVKNQLNECESNRSDLSQQIEDNKQEVQNKQNKIDELEWLKNELEAVKNGEIDGLRHELHNLQKGTEELNHLKTEMESQKNAEIDHLKQEIAQQQQRVEEMEVSKAGKEEDHFKSLEVAQNQMRSQEEELQALKQELEEMRGNSVARKSSDEATRTKLNELSQRKAELKAENWSLKEQAIEMNKKITELSSKEEQETSSTEETIQNLKRELEEVNQWFNDAKWRCGELEATLSQKQGEINSATDRIQHLEWEISQSREELDVVRRKSGEMERALGEKDARFYETEQKLKALEEQRSQSPNQQVKNGNTDAIYELTDELKVCHQKKYEMEGQITKMSADLKKSHSRCKELDSEVKRLGDELGTTYERRHQMEEATGRMDWERNDLGNKLNDAQGRIKWLEGELDGLWKRHRDLEHRSGELQGFKDKAYQYLPDAFIVRKEAYVDRDRWDLAMWKEDRADQFVRVWFELDVPHARHVYLMGSFFNWECGLLCTLHDHGKHGVWVDIPRGRHEFRFMVDGRWATSHHFQTVPNEFGSDNNWRIVE